jgi:hypothetical protein
MSRHAGPAAPGRAGFDTDIADPCPHAASPAGCGGVRVGIGPAGWPSPRVERLVVVGVGCGHPTANGIPTRSDRTWILGPGLPRSTGLGPVSEPPFGPDAGSVNDRAGPVDQPLAAQFVEHGLVQTPPEPGASPFGKCSVRGHRHLERRCQISPFTPTGQHEHYRGDHRSRGDTRPATTLRTNLRRRDQRLDQRPQLVGHQPLRQLVDHNR